MLTQEIRKKIDSARNILVGKVSDPKAQVEQITTALIYKFMDDMDKQAASLPKGKVRFFINGYGKYAWSKMMDAKLGGQERLNLYVEAITKMSKNPNKKEFRGRLLPLPLCNRQLAPASATPLRVPCKSPKNFTKLGTLLICVPTAPICR